MRIEAERYKLDMTEQELWNTAWDVRHTLINTLKTHWINHQQSWEKHEADRLCRLKTMFLALGRPDIYEEIKPMAKTIFDEFNSKSSA